MKKYVVIMLSLLVLLCLAGCAGKVDDNGTDSDQDIVNTGSDDQEANNEQSEGKAFDTSWTSNEFEALIPELPFSGWTVIGETDTKYELELGGLSTANGADTKTGFETDKDNLIAYINTLPGYGFNVEEIGENYQWLITDENGNEIEIICGDGYCWITFTKAS